MGYGSEDVDPFGICDRKIVTAPYAYQIVHFITEINRREVRENLQEGLIWKFKDCLNVLASAPPT